MQARAARPCRLPSPRNRSILGQPGRGPRPQAAASRIGRALFALAVAALLAPAARGMGELTGNAHYQTILAQPSSGWTELYEFNLWLCPMGEETALGFRAGAPPETAPTYDGTFRFPRLRDGFYSLISTQPLFFPRAAILPTLEIRNGQVLRADAVPALDYSCSRTADWDPAWAPLWHQTFVARGTSITRASTRLAGRDAGLTELAFTIHADNGSPDITTWPQVGPTRTRPAGGGDIFVAWLSDEVPTTPGQLCAVRLHDAGGNALFTPFRVIDTGSGYRDGQAYKNGAATNADLNLLVCSDSDGTRVTMGVVNDWNGNELGGWASHWAQSWIARGSDLAGLDLWFALGSDWRHEARFSIHRGGLDGPGVGPIKSGKSNYQTPGSGWLAVSYCPGEIPLVPGELYCVEILSSGMNCYMMPRASPYASGTAYRDRVPYAGGRDLYMSIYEYTPGAAPPPVQPPPVIQAATEKLANADFELGQTGTSGQTPTSWTKFQISGNTTWWFGGTTDSYGRNDTKGPRVIGGAINGTVFDGGLVQRVTGLDPGKDYIVSGWVASNVGTSLLHWSMLGYDLTGQTGNPRAATVIWVPLAGMKEEWKSWQSGIVRPTASAISVWLRGGTSSKTDTFFADFDDFSLREVVVAPATTSIESY